MKTLITLALCTFVSLSACAKTNPSASNSAENVATVRADMPKDCQEYFDGLKALAKHNQNLADKFGDELKNVDQSWHTLTEAERDAFGNQCTIRNQQLKKMQDTPELEKLLNEL